MSVEVETRDDQVATGVAATIAANPTATIETPPTADPTDPTPEKGTVYFDQELGFKIRYDPSWTFSAVNGTGLSILDGRGRTLGFEKAGYYLEITVLDGAADPGCGGLLGSDFSIDDFHVFRIDSTEVWRIKAEDGFVNGFHMEDMSFLEIISPEEVYEAADENGYLGIYNCRFLVSDHLVAISYRLPLSVSQLEAGEIDRSILDEMDAIAASLSWDL